MSNSRFQVQFYPSCSCNQRWVELFAESEKKTYFFPGSKGNLMIFFTCGFPALKSSLVVPELSWLLPDWWYFLVESVSEVMTSMKSSWQPPNVTTLSYEYLARGCMECWSSNETPSSLMAIHNTLLADKSSNCKKGEVDSKSWKRRPECLHRKEKYWVHFLY